MCTTPFPLITGKKREECVWSVYVWNPEVWKNHVNRIIFLAKKRVLGTSNPCCMVPKVFGTLIYRQELRFTWMVHSLAVVYGKSTCASQRKVNLHGPPPQPATGCHPEPQRIERPRIASWALPDTLPPMNLRQTRHMLYIVKGQNPDEHTSDTRSSKQSEPCSRTDHCRYECNKLLKEHIHDATGPSMKTSMHTYMLDETRDQLTNQLYQLNEIHQGTSFITALSQHTHTHIYIYAQDLKPVHVSNLMWILGLNLMHCIMDWLLESPAKRSGFQ